MKHLFVFLSILLMLATSSFATYVAVLETVADASAKDSVTLSDRQYLTNVLRGEAIKELPAAQGYTIMTRENILQMLPPGKAIEDCEGSCLVETGKNIAADYICQARVGHFGSSLTLSAEFYETAGNKLIASFNGRGENVENLLELIERESPAFLRVVRDMVQPTVVPEVAPTVAETVVEEQDSVRTQANEAYDELDGKKVELPNASEISTAENASIEDNNVGESVPTNVNTDVTGDSAKKSGIHWVPLGISGSVAVVGGIMACVFNHKAKNATSTPPQNKQEFQKGHDDADKNQSLRNVSLGLMAAGLVGVGITFLF